MATQLRWPSTTLLPKILAGQPQLVVMELGGHDYKDGEPRDQTKARLRQIIQELTDADIEVVIVEIIRGFISDPFYGVERELAAEFDLELIPGHDHPSICVLQSNRPAGILAGFFSAS